MEFHLPKTLPQLLTACRIKSKSLHMIKKPLHDLSSADHPTLITHMAPSFYPNQELTGFGGHNGVLGIPQALHNPTGKTGIQRKPGIRGSRGKVRDLAWVPWRLPRGWVWRIETGKGGKGDLSRICSTERRWEDGQEQAWQRVVTNLQIKYLWNELINEWLYRHFTA